MPLTKATVEGSKPKERPYDLRDGGAAGVTGLILRVYPSGKRTFFYQRHRGEKWFRIGQAGPITLAQARGEAVRIYQSLLDGEQPVTRATSTAKSTGKDDRMTWSRFRVELYAPHYTAHHRTDKGLANLGAFKGWDDLPLEEISRTRVQRWRTERLAGGVKAATVNRCVAALKAALAFAVSDGILDAHPLIGLARLTVDEPNRIRYLSEEEESRLWSALATREQRIRDERRSANQWRKARGYDLLPDLSNYKFADHLRPMVIVSMNTGIRQGELFHLRWRDILNEVLTVDSGHAKSRKTRRVPLNTTAASTLEHWRAQTDAKVYVFESRDGRPFDNIKSAWHGVLEAAQIHDFRWHDLRHHFASMLVMGGHASDAVGETEAQRKADQRQKQRQRAVPLNSVRELLGHADLQMTLRYAHLAPGQLRDAVEVLSHGL